MKYSCFDAAAGLYRVYEDGATLAINGDLPVPSLPGALNGIGVPASSAGRALPAEASYIGDSWQPIGIVVRCSENQSIGSLGTDPAPATNVGSILLILAGVVVSVYLIQMITTVPRR